MKWYVKVKTEKYTGIDRNIFKTKKEATAYAKQLEESVKNVVSAEVTKKGSIC